MIANTVVDSHTPPFPMEDEASERGGRRAALRRNVVVLVAALTPREDPETMPTVNNTTTTRQARGDKKIRIFNQSAKSSPLLWC